jgi:hypothetical protein
MTGRRTAPVAIACALAVLAGLIAGCGGGTTPTIIKVQPDSGAGGSVIAVTGTGFTAKQGSNKVLFGDAAGTVQSWTDTGIAVLVPSDLKAGQVQVTVNAGGKTSNGVLFKITSASSPASSQADAKKKGEIENNTPVQAMLAYLKSKGEPTDGWNFAVFNVSKTDPSWKIDSGLRTGGSGQTQYFLLHKVNGNWQALVYGTDFNPQQFGAPADLSLTPPAPPRPSDQAKAIQTYLAAKGRPTDGWALSVLKESAVDPNWEIIKGTRQGVNDNFLLVWNNMLGDWECLADGGPPWPGVDFKGAPVPSDLNSI